MMGAAICPRILLTTLYCLLTLALSASAEGAWMAVHRPGISLGRSRRGSSVWRLCISRLKLSRRSASR
jgi:hypothetical protein